MAGKQKIMVVDDEPSIRKYLRTLLEVDGFEVETLPNGKEALKEVGFLSKMSHPSIISYKVSTVAP